MVTSFLGNGSPLVILVAATASGGEMIAPKIKANGHEKPGMILWAMMAMIVVVRKTNPTANSDILENSFLNSGIDVFQAASNKMGGKTT